MYFSPGHNLFAFLASKDAYIRDLQRKTNFYCGQPITRAVTPYEKSIKSIPGTYLYVVALQKSP